LALDLAETALQLDTMAVGLKNSVNDTNMRSESASTLLEDFNAKDFEARIDLSSKVFNWSAPSFPLRPAESIATSDNPVDYLAIGVDGSHIDINRHIPVRCFLINTGVARLRYGGNPNAYLSSTPHLFSGLTDTAIFDKSNINRSIPIQGSILGAVRTVEEIKTLATALENIDPVESQLPVIGLVDGTLVMLDLLRAGIPDYVIRNILDDGFLTALNKIRQMSKNRKVVIASYISLPGSTEVMDGIRLLGCPFPKSDCLQHCGTRSSGERPCDAYALGLLDRDVFAKRLSRGQRTEIFGSSSELVKSYYRENEVKFFYVNTGDEIARVEMPKWVAEDESSVSLVHSLVVEQCKLGSGYPACLMEAHEQAVISTSDRSYFLNLVEEVLEGQDMRFYTSRKDHSKRIRWL